MKIYRNAVELYDLVIDGQTQLTKKLMGEDMISLQVTTSTTIDLQVGDYALIGAVKYEMNRPAKLNKISAVEYKYEAQLEGPVYRLLDKIVLLNGKSMFSLVGTLEDFIDLLLSNINEINTGWTKGAMLATERKTLTVSGQNCKEFLDTLMSEFSCEYALVNKVLSTALTVESATALTFEVGKNKGLYNLTRESVDDQNTVTRAYIYGSARNLDFSYRNNAGRLMFQNVDGTHYLENTSEYNRIVEKDVVFEDIWPKFTGTVGVVSGDYKTITCNAIDFDLNAQQLVGIAPKAVFLTGDLMGVTFAISYVHATKQLTLTPVSQAGGLVLPSISGFPKAGDQFTFIDIQMPASYITNAEALLKTEGQKWLNYYSKLRVRYALTLDARYIRDNAISLKIGEVVRIIDKQISIDKQIRITALKMSLDGKSITADISNYREEVFSKQISSKLNDTVNQLTQNQAAIEEVKNNNTGSRLTGGVVSKTIPNLTKAVALIDTDKLEAHAVSKTESGYIDLAQLSAYIKSKLGVIVGATKTTWDRDMHIAGNVTASGDVIAYMAGAVTSDVLDALSVSAPLAKTGTNIALNINSLQLEVNASNQLQIKPNILIPADHNQDISTINGLQTALDAKQVIGSYETAFSKNTGFNKNFGTTAGTVSEGHTHPYLGSSDSRITSWVSAATNSHTHSNKAVIDGITSGLVFNWNAAHTKTLPFTVTPTLVTVDRDMHIVGNLTASKEVVAYLSGAVTSDVLDALSVSAPLAKTGTNIALNYNTSQFELSGSTLQIKSAILIPAVHNQDISTINGLATALSNKLETSLKGLANGLAELNASGFVKNTQLPSYVDDVLEYGSFALLPTTGESGKIYITTDTNKTYRWSGSVYAVISDTLALGTTSATAFRGDYGNTAYAHRLLTTNPHSVTKAQVGLGSADNTSDVNKSVNYAANSGLFNNLNSSVFVKNNSTNSADLLGLITIIKSIQLTTNWQNTGISNTELLSALYLFTVSCNDYPVGGNYSQTYTGQLYWFASGTNDTNSDEIILHSNGHASNGQTIYLRTKRNGHSSQTFEIAANYATTAVSNYTFNFRRLI